MKEIKGLGLFTGKETSGSPSTSLKEDSCNKKEEMVTCNGFLLQLTLDELVDYGCLFKMYCLSILVIYLFCFYLIIKFSYSII